MSLKSVLEKHGIACAFGCDIKFKNGSTIKVSEYINDNVRGNRSKYIEPFWGDEPYVDVDKVKEVLEEFMNKEKVSIEDIGYDIFLSSARRFNIGDRVRVVKVLKDDFMCGEPDSPYGYKDKCGIITKAYDDVWNYDVEVRMDIDGQVVCWLDGELELVSKNQSL